MKTIFTALTIAFLLFSGAINAQTMMVKDINLGSSNSNPYSYTNVNGTLYFQAQTATYGPELWKSDGKDAGTVMVKDIYPGSSPSWNPHYLFNFKDAVYFIANDGTQGYELWKSDGTEAGTATVKEIHPGEFGALDGIQHEPAFINFKDALYFIAYYGTNGTELWKSDGSAEGTEIVKNISNGYLGSSPSGLIDVNGTLFFFADNGTNGYELWKSDGSAEGTVMVKDINPGTNSSEPMYPAPLTNVNGTLYFWAQTISYGTELWKSDGTDAGTVMVKDINPGATSSLNGDIQDVVSLNDIFYFSADDGTNGEELWKSDGTLEGTVMVKDIYPGASGSSAEDLTSFKGTLYFAAQDGTTGYELWKSDGSEAGTIMVKDINPGNGVSISYPNSITNVNGTLYFSGNDGIHGTEFWKSDGTAEGTTMATDINPGGGSSYPYSFTNVNGTIYFTATDGIKGSELWRYDPTSSSVEKEIHSVNIISIFPNPLTSESIFKINKYLKDATLTIYNSFGQQVKQITPITIGLGQSIALHRDNLPCGLYFIRLTQDDQTIATDKLIIAD